MSAARVAKIGFSALMKGKTFVIPGFINKVLAFAGRVAPRAVPTAVAASLNKRI
jgi:short-subunit dehydrogenase